MWLINKVHLSDQKPQGILNQHADQGAKRDVDFKKKRKIKGRGGVEGGMDWEVEVSRCKLLHIE